LFEKITDKLTRSAEPPRPLPPTWFPSPIDRSQQKFPMESRAGIRRLRSSLEQPGDQLFRLIQS